MELFSARSRGKAQAAWGNIQLCLPEERLRHPRKLENRCAAALLSVREQGEITPALREYLNNSWSASRSRKAAQPLDYEARLNLHAERHTDGAGRQSAAPPRLFFRAPPDSPVARSDRSDHKRNGKFVFLRRARGVNQFLHFSALIRDILILGYAQPELHCFEMGAIWQVLKMPSDGLDRSPMKHRQFAQRFITIQFWQQIGLVGVGISQGTGSVANHEMLHGIHFPDGLDQFLRYIVLHGSAIEVDIDHLARL